jgi:hypothetical protein
MLPYPIILSIINQKRIVMLNKSIEQMEFMEYALVVPALFAFFYAVSSKCRGAGKS